MKGWLLRPPSQDDLIQVLQAWRVWLLATFIGALVGSALYFIIPPVYRAQATVTVDHDLEQAWPDANTERDLMTYLSRETQKLIQVAWADATLQLVVDQIPGTTLASLRSGALLLSQPSDGAWHFWADDQDPLQAELLASTWARAFYERSLQGVEIATQLQAARSTPTDSTPSEHIQELERKSLGISPYLQISLSQAEQIPVKRTLNALTTTLTGAACAWVLTLLGPLL